MSGHYRHKHQQYPLKREARMAKILVAEDEQDIRELVVDTLFDRGSDVFEAGPFQNDSDLVFRGVLPVGPGRYLPDESLGLLS